jgi:hypothetical protein
MISLSELCISTGIVSLVVYLPFLVAPEWAQKGLRIFPRNIWVGGILAAVALIWSAFEINDMPLGGVDAYKSWLLILGPVVYGLIMVFMNELLAPRALGGLLMLSAGPLLEAQRLYESSWTVVPAVMAYGWVVAGMILVLSPYRFRHAAQFCCGTTAACRWTGIFGLGLGAFLIGLGLLVFGGAQ